MFPKFIQPIIKCTPIFVITYGPAKLLIDFSIQRFIQICIAQILYLTISSAFIGVLYSKGVKKLNVNGG